MPDITLIAPDGAAYEIDTPAGLTVMQAATGYGVPGILADCGGQCICATCHVVVDEAWIARLPPPSSQEDDLLDGTAAPREPGSRLSCQIVVVPALHGLTMRVPDT